MKRALIHKNNKKAHLLNFIPKPFKFQKRYLFNSKSGMLVILLSSFAPVIPTCLTFI